MTTDKLYTALIAENRSHYAIITFPAPSPEVAIERAKMAAREELVIDGEIIAADWGGDTEHAGEERIVDLYEVDEETGKKIGDPVVEAIYCGTEAELPPCAVDALFSDALKAGKALAFALESVRNLKGIKNAMVDEALQGWERLLANHAASIETWKNGERPEPAEAAKGGDA